MCCKRRFTNWTEPVRRLNPVPLSLTATASLRCRYQVAASRRAIPFFLYRSTRGLAFDFFGESADVIGAATSSEADHHQLERIAAMINIVGSLPILTHSLTHR